MECVAPVFTFAAPVCEPGDYTIPFSFQLPPAMPSSLYFKRDSGKKPSAKVKYSIKATMHCADKHDDMKHKQVLTIREAPTQVEASIS